mgnify:CR=1 FL=1
MPECSRSRRGGAGDATVTAAGGAAVGARRAWYAGGAMTIKATGRWSVDGENLVTSDVKTEASSEDAFTNMMAGIGSSIANTFMAQKAGSANVQKLTRTELVYTPIGVDDPPVISCTR